jgi:hypothetical protein
MGRREEKDEKADLYADDQVGLQPTRSAVSAFLHILIPTTVLAHRPAVSTKSRSQCIRRRGHEAREQEKESTAPSPFMTLAPQSRAPSRPSSSRLPLPLSPSSSQRIFESTHLQMPHRIKEQILRLDVPVRDTLRVEISAGRGRSASYSLKLEKRKQREAREGGQSRTRPSCPRPTTQRLRTRKQ